MGERIIEIIVGLFMVAAMTALFVLAFKVSGLSGYTGRETYTIIANFDNVGDLKVRAPVKIAGVRVGSVHNIHLDKETYKASVEMKIDQQESHIPTDTTASILTAGLLGSSYISLEPGFEPTYLGQDGVIEITQPAMILENLISRLLFNVKGSDQN